MNYATQFGIISESTIQIFTCGLCFKFARALSQRCKLKNMIFVKICKVIKGIKSPYKIDEIYDGMPFEYSIHGFCELPNGKYADITGIFSPNDFISSWIGPDEKYKIKECELGNNYYESITQSSKDSEKKGIFHHIFVQNYIDSIVNAFIEKYNGTNGFAF